MTGGQKRLGTPRILALPRYGRLGASSRLRTLQYLPALRDAGLQVDLAPLLEDSYVTGLYSGSISTLGVTRAYLRHLQCLIFRRHYDVLWVEKELFPWLPAAIELALIPSRTALVVDYDDAVFHRYDEHRSGTVRKALGHKIDAVMRRANLVTAGNDYLAQRALDAGCKRVEWLPTVIDLKRYPAQTATVRKAGPVVVGWIGSPSTAPYLQMVVPALVELARTHDIRCVAIGARPDQLTGTPFEAWEWTEATEVSLLQQLDIGIMPLPDAPWERGKCGYKLIQYMACSVPVVASLVGVNRDIVRVGENGFLATTMGEWMDALATLVTDPELRARLGAAGRRQVEDIYCLQAQAPRLVAMLESAAAGRLG